MIGAKQAVVHPLQIVNEKTPIEPHEMRVDFIAMPDRIIESKTALPRPKVIYWEYLDEEKIAATPLLKEMKSRLGN